MGLVPRSRAANRARVLDDLLDAARAELVEVGPASLSLRSVARRLDVVPSALYRYVAGRDALLTLLIVDAYQRFGHAVAQADAIAAARRGATPADRWLAVGRGARAWAIAHRADWALLYGSPVVGYQAPPDTIEPAGALVRVVAGIVAAAHPDRAPPAPAHPDPAHPEPAEAPIPLDLPVPAPLRRWLAVVRTAAGSFDQIPDALVALAVIGWVHVVGGISVELFGQYGPDATPAAAIHDHGLRVSATLLGLGPTSR